MLDEHVSEKHEMKGAFWWTSIQTGPMCVYATGIINGKMNIYIYQKELNTLHIAELCLFETLCIIGIPQWIGFVEYMHVGGMSSFFTLCTIRIT